MRFIALDRRWTTLCGMWLVFDSQCLVLRQNWNLTSELTRLPNTFLVISIQLKRMINTENYLRSTRFSRVIDWMDFYEFYFVGEGKTDKIHTFVVSNILCKYGEKCIGGHFLEGKTSEAGLEQNFCLFFGNGEISSISLLLARGL